MHRGQWMVRMLLLPFLAHKIKTMKNILLLLVIFFTQQCTSQITFNQNWSTYYGGKNTTPFSIEADSEGNVYIAGWVFGQSPYSNSFVTTGAYRNYYGGASNDGFISKYSNNGTLLWATYYGGLNLEGFITDMAIDNVGNIYVTGLTQSNVGIATAGSFQPQLTVDSDPNSPDGDAFLAKFSPLGELVWGTYFGGTAAETPNAMTIDGNNNVIICGYAQSITSVATEGSYQPSVGISGGTNYNSFIAKFDTLGSLLWSTYYGNGKSIGISDITTDSNNDIYVIGLTDDNSGFFATPSCYKPNLSGTRDCFLSKFNSSGTIRIWSTYLGGNLNEFDSKLTFKNNALYVLGQTNSTSGLATALSYQSTLAGGRDVFFGKLNSTNGYADWITYYGGALNEIAYSSTSENSIKVDDDGLIYITGNTFSTNNIASSNGFKNSISGGSDSFVAVFDDSQQRLWASYFGGEGDETSSKIVLGQNGDLFIAGETSSATQIATVGASQPNLSVAFFSPTPQGNAFVSKFTKQNLNTETFTLSNISVFPNPTSELVTIKLNNIQQKINVEVYNVLSQKIQDAVYYATSTISIPLTGNSGVYFLKVNTQNGSCVLKIIKK